MTRTIKTAVLSMLLVFLLAASAQAMENNMLKVGLKYGESAVFSARLQNYGSGESGLGYEFGYYDSGCVFVPITSTDVQLIAVTVDKNAYVSGEYCYELKPASYSTILGGYHIELLRDFATYEEALAVAQGYNKAFVAYIDDVYRVRIGNHASYDESEGVLAGIDVSAYGAQIVSPSNTGVVVSVPGTDTVLFEFDCGGLRSLAVQPRSLAGEKTITWSGGYRYFGGFEFQRTTGGNLSVINVVNIEDYVKCVIPYEMSNDWPLEALKAQSVCARTYAAEQTRHRREGFDICASIDCQVYYGASKTNAHTDAAVDGTEGVYLFYNGVLVDNAVYYSCNGGASEDCKNVWNSDIGYLKGKEDPFEADITARKSDYYWSYTLTPAELTAILKAKGVNNIGSVKNVYVSRFTDTGNVLEITFEGTNGTYVASKERCRTIFNNVLDGVTVKSMRFNILGSDTGTFFINGAMNYVTGISSTYVLTADGKVSKHGLVASDTYVLTADGLMPLEEKKDTAEKSFTITGSGHGHNVGMSQWGAFAMAQRGYTYRDILEFYYTDIRLLGMEGNV